MENLLGLKVKLTDSEALSALTAEKIAEYYRAGAYGVRESDLIYVISQIVGDKEVIVPKVNFHDRWKSEVLEKLAEMSGVSELVMYARIMGIPMDMPSVEIELNPDKIPMLNVVVNQPTRVTVHETGQFAGEQDMESVYLPQEMESEDGDYF